MRILIVAGGVRGGGYVEVKQYFFDLLEAIERVDSHQIHLTIVTGKQERLHRRLEKYVGQLPFDVNLLGFTQSMHELMANHDVLIGKPGGLIVAEALACGMGLILFKPGPGQESANVDFLARHGVAFRGETPGEMEKVLRRILSEPQRIQEVRRRAKNLGAPESARSVANYLLRTLEPIG